MRTEVTALEYIHNENPNYGVYVFENNSGKENHIKDILPKILKLK